MNNDSEVASILNLTTRKYRNILRKHGARVIKTAGVGNDLLFETRKQANEAIKQLEPFVIMMKLMK
jgi:hypothetical protein